MKKENKVPSFFQMDTRKGHPFFAAFYNFISKKFDAKIFGSTRSFLLKKVQGKTLEIGVGTGANFPYYAKTIQLTGIDPDPYMIKIVDKKMGKGKGKGKENNEKENNEKLENFAVEILRGAAENLPFADSSFDSVVSTLVLCSVTSPSQSLNEIKRVLRPGGKFYFIEHVQSSYRPFAQLHGLLTPLWKCIAGGCHLDRQTEKEISQAGLIIEEIYRKKNLNKYYFPLIWGVARKE